MTVTKLASALALLAIYPHDHPVVTNDPCLTTSYYGTYGTQSIFIPKAACYEEKGLSEPDVMLDISAYNTGDQLVWVEEAAMDPKFSWRPKPRFEGIEGWLSLLAIPEYANPDDALTVSPSSQEPLSAPHRAYTVLHRTANSALLALPPQYAYALSSVLPTTWRIYALPDTPVPLVPVPAPAIEHVRTILDNLKFDPLIARIVSNISLPQIKNDIRWLTGEDGQSGIVSRHSFSQGARTTADWLKLRVEETGAKCELRTYLAGFAPNVICRYPSTVNTTATVLVSAHYDSRGSFGSARAPGGNDDGSGTTGILGIARTIKRMGVTFRSNVELVAFTGEEQGLYGSRYYSQDLRAENKNLTLMIQADMTAYHEPGEPLQLGLPERIGTQEVTQLIANISAIYSPELHVGYTPACCSDHQSFHYQGFPASQVFERAGPIADPMYHNSGDLSEREGYDFEQLKSIAKVQFATILHAAGYDLP